MRWWRSLIRAQVYIRKVCADWSLIRALVYIKESWCTIPYSFRSTRDCIREKLQRTSRALEWEGIWRWVIKDGVNVSEVSVLFHMKLGEVYGHASSFLSPLIHFSLQFTHILRERCKFPSLLKYNLLKTSSEPTFPSPILLLLIKPTPSWFNTITATMSEDYFGRTDTWPAELYCWQGADVIGSKTHADDNPGLERESTPRFSGNTFRSPQPILSQIFPSFLMPGDCGAFVIIIYS